MASYLVSFLSISLLLHFFVHITPTPAAAEEDLNLLITCLQAGGITNITLYSPNPDSQYSALLNFSARNLRYVNSNLPKPALIVLPQTEPQVQRAVKCSVREGWEIRIRSGGHSFEGLSYVGDVPRFLVIDLINLDAIHIDLVSETAWVQSGASLGQLYYAISQASSLHAFPATPFATIGVGGHLSGGGEGFLVRKHGLGADHVIDARVVNYKGELLERSQMGEDLFWALRGGGGGSWGVVVAWRIELVPVPPLLTSFAVIRMGIDEVIDLVYKWQLLWQSSNNLTDDIHITATVLAVRNGNARDIGVRFQGSYLGLVNDTLALVNSLFPELVLTTNDCKEVPWIEVIRVQANSLGEFYNDTQSLTNKSTPYRLAFKIKSDFVTSPLPKSALEKVFHVIEQDPGSGSMTLIPTGGIMYRIPSDAIPYPHRAGNLYSILYDSIWSSLSDNEVNIKWVRRLHKKMTPYVSHSPRRAYVNDLDLDLGVALNGTATVAQAAKWGKPYFVGNYERLVEIKCKVDPYNVFRNHQSIPPCKSTCGYPISNSAAF